MLLQKNSYKIMNLTRPPIVLVFAGNDPTGGAGLCADIQALASQGCHAAPVVTCITVQNTHNVMQNLPLPGIQVAAQAEAILADMPIAACKIGLLGSVEIIAAVQQILLQHPQLPVILDPILAAGGGYALATSDIRQAMIEKLLPLTQILTPNSQEARALTNHPDSLDTAAIQLMALGCRFICITGTHENTTQVTNTLYGNGRKLKSWNWNRLPHEYHGSGCTLAASLAGLMAQGKDVETAVAEAQTYTWQSLHNGYQPGLGQWLPNRFYWASQEIV
jgi:hydroxymethylpyrimidine/phosphomethylpyrimidine kinase